MHEVQQSLVLGLAVLSVSVLPSQGQGIVFGDSKAPPAANCRTSTNQNGWCTEITNCPPILAAAHINTHKVCGYRGTLQIVCCPTSVGLLETSTSSTVLPDVSPPNVSFRCGRRERNTVGNRPQTQGPLSRDKRFIVVGGINAQFGDWPWAALIGVFRDTLEIDWICNGVLINNQWVLTAAHCLLTKNVYVVRLGELDYALTDDTTATPRDFNTDEIVFHPQYTFPAVYNDLALVNIKRPVPFSDAIQPACLPWGAEIDRNLNGDTVTLAGWGATEFGGSGSSILQEVDLTVFSRDACARNYGSLFDFGDKFPKGFTDGTLCVGDARGGKDACSGDSGGALVYQDNQSRFTVAGTVSTGYGCGSADYPGVYIPMHNRDILAWVKSIAF